MAGMSTGEHVHSGTIDWYVEPDYTRHDVRARESMRARHDQERAHSLGLIITTSLLFVLFAAAVTFGGHAAIVPLLQEAVAARDAQGLPVTGSIVYTMPDGVYCRYLSFDNTSGEFGSAAIRQCPDQAREESSGAVSSFKWNNH
jgi:hypothetical protein